MNTVLSHLISMKISYVKGDTLKGVSPQRLRSRCTIYFQVRCIMNVV